MINDRTDSAAPADCGCSDYELCIDKPNCKRAPAPADGLVARLQHWSRVLAPFRTLDYSPLLAAIDEAAAALAERRQDDARAERERADRLWQECENLRAALASRPCPPTGGIPREPTAYMFIAGTEALARAIAETGSLEALAPGGLTLKSCAI